MALKLNIAQINSAAKGNNDLRETLTGIYNEFQSVYQQTGAAPIQKVDATPVKFSGATVAVRAIGDRRQRSVQCCDYPTAASGRIKRTAELDQRAHLSGIIEFDGRQLFVGRRDLPISARTRAMSFQTRAHRSTGGSDRVTTRRHSTATKCSRGS